MRKLIVAFFCLFFFPTVVFAATKKVPTYLKSATDYPRQGGEFSSAIVIDVASGKELYTYQPNKRWPAASLTKLVNALVFLDSNPRWGKIVTLLAKDEVGGGRLRVASGARLSLQDLLYSSIVGSANNAAMAMARLTGVSITTFLKRMNLKAKAIGMTHSVFYDPVGMDPRNMTTAHDLVKLARVAFGKRTIQKAASTITYSFYIRNNGQKHTIKNTDALLTKDPDVWVTGSKTGYLEESMNNLIVQLQDGPRGTKQRLLVIVLGSPDKNQMFASAKALAQWAWKSYSWPSSGVRAAINR